MLLIYDNNTKVYGKPSGFAFCAPAEIIIGIGARSRRQVCDVFWQVGAKMTFPDQPRFLDVFSYSVYGLLQWFRRFGVVVAALSFMAISLIIVLKVIAGPREKPVELPPMYNSMGLQVSNSPFDSKFHHAAVAGGGAQWASIVGQARQIGDPVQRMNFIHRFVTTYVTYTDDTVLYRTTDYWATPSETLARRRGDCEDYAILEMMLLQASGFRPADIYLTIGFDLVARRDHAVLSVKIDNMLWTLDQRAPAPFPTSSVIDFRPILTLSQDNVWLHGFRKKISNQIAAIGR